MTKNTNTSITQLLCVESAHPTIIPFYTNFTFFNNHYTNQLTNQL